jgi:signal transduction histidine kinase
MNWIIYFVPPLLLGGLEVIRLVIGDDLADNRWLYGAFILLALAGMAIFALGISRYVERMHHHLVHQNQELLALHEASIAISSDLRLERVLQDVVNEASTLVGARYGAISCARESPHLEAFVTYGISPELRAQIGPPPFGHGILSIPIASGDSLRLDDISADPRSVGFPPHHPAMTRLLAVPIATQSGIFGNLYLSDKHDGSPFTATDEDSLRRFASLAAIAIENAALHEQVQVLAITGERERIAREMHDSLAQLLAWVNTKSQAALAYLGRDNTTGARDQIEQLAQSAREAYVDVREGIFALRSATVSADHDLFDSLTGYIDRWQVQHGIPVTLDIQPDLNPHGLTSLAEIHVLRLIQEALTNIRKHAHATKITIEFRAGEVQWHLTITDDGVGFDPAGSIRGEIPRFGLSTMRERAEAIGGTFALSSAPGQGTRIDVTIPVSQA